MNLAGVNWVARRNTEKAWDTMGEKACAKD
jgi:hypothetical protein